MIKITVWFLAVALGLCLAACSKTPKPAQSPKEPPTETADTEKAEESAWQSREPAGSWHLDREKNDLAALPDRFPGYAEWGAAMEIRSDGQLSWYIGAEGWQGTCEVNGGTLHAVLDSELDERTLSWNFSVTEENESVILEMEYEDMTLCWVYGEQAEGADGSALN